MKTKLRIAIAFGITALFQTSLVAQTLKYNTEYFCNRERIIVSYCRSDSDRVFMPATHPSNDYCKVSYPDRPKQNGFSVETAELKSDVIKKLQACGAIGSTTATQANSTSAVDANLYWKQGTKYYDAKDYAKAIAEYQKAIVLNPSMAVAYHDLGAAYYNLTQYKESLAALQQAARLNPNNANTHDWLGKVYFTLEQYPEALSAYKQTLALKPATASIHLNLGTAYYKLKKYNEALAEFQEEIRLAPNVYTNHYWAGATYFQLKQYPKALEELDEAVRLNPKDSYSHHWVGEVYLVGFKDYEKALIAYLESRRLNSNYAINMNQLGVAYNKLKQYDNALAAAKEAQRLEPKNAQYQFNLGMAYFNVGNKTEANAVATKLFWLDKAKAQELYNTINKTSAGATTTATTKTTKTSETNSELTETEKRNAKLDAEELSMEGNAEFWQRLKEHYDNKTPLPTAPESFAKGEKFFAAKEYAKAIPEYKNAIERDPKFADGYNSLALSYMKTSQWKLAIDTWTTFRTLKKMSPSALLLMGEAHLTLRQYDDALKILREVSAAKPKAIVTELSDMHYWIGRTHYASGIYSNAVISFKDALRVNPKNAIANRDLGVAYYRLKEIPNAIAALQKSILQNPNDGLAQYDLGFIYVETGKKAEAETIYAKLQTIDKKLAQDLFNHMNRSVAKKP